jgi:hypothetical protein
VEDESKYVVAILQGLDQTGKTHFAFSAPEPILCMTFDPGNIKRGVARKYKGKNIQLATFEIPKGLVATSALATAARNEQNRWEEIYTEAVEGEYFKTIILDREDETWELFRYEEFDGKQGAKAHHYTPLNAHYKALLKLAEKNKKNLLMIDAVKDEWKNEKPTGKKVKEGFRHLGMLSQLTLEHEVDQYDNFSINVVRCRDNATRNGGNLTKEVISEYLNGELGIDYPADEATGEATWFEVNFSNCMAYLIGGQPNEWE